MPNHPNRGRSVRPRSLLDSVGGDFPDAWYQIETFRAGKGKDLPDWPDWCFLPMAAWYSIVSADLQVDKIALPMIGQVSRLAALGAWRYTQGVYRLDEDLFRAVADTVPAGALPVDVLYRLPEWCVYIETPDHCWFDTPMYGFFAHLERDMNTGRDELRFLIDADEGLIPAPVHLGKWTITEAVDRAVAEAGKQAAIAGFSHSVPGDLVELLSGQYYGLVSLLLYVCSNGVDYPDQQRPQYASPKRTKKGWKLFPAAKPRIWKLGEKTGDAIRRAKAAQSSERKGPAPHIRRAHWHGFWSGPRDGEREFNLQWLPPIVVAGDE